MQQVSNESFNASGVYVVERIGFKPDAENGESKFVFPGLAEHSNPMYPYDLVRHLIDMTSMLNDEDEKSIKNFGFLILSMLPPHVELLNLGVVTPRGKEIVLMRNSIPVEKAQQAKTTWTLLHVAALADSLLHLSSYDIGKQKAIDANELLVQVLARPYTTTVPNGIQSYAHYGYSLEAAKERNFPKVLPELYNLLQFLSVFAPPDDKKRKELIFRTQTLLKYLPPVIQAINLGRIDPRDDKDIFVVGESAWPIIVCGGRKLLTLSIKDIENIASFDSK